MAHLLIDCRSNCWMPMLGGRCEAMNSPTSAMTQYNMRLLYNIVHSMSSFYSMMPSKAALLQDPLRVCCPGICHPCRCCWCDARQQCSFSAG